MSRLVRLTAWVVAVAGALAWPVFLPAIVWVQLIFLVALAVLWWAAPRDSIRLPFGWSAALIVGGAVLLHVVAIGRGGSSVLPSTVSMLMLIALVLAMRSSTATVWGLAPAAWAWWITIGWWGAVSMTTLGPLVVWIARRRVQQMPNAV